MYLLFASSILTHLHFISFFFLLLHEVSINIFDQNPLLLQATSENIPLHFHSLGITIRHLSDFLSLSLTADRITYHTYHTYMTRNKKQLAS